MEVRPGTATPELTSVGTNLRNCRVAFGAHHEIDASGASVSQGQGHVKGKLVFDGEVVLKHVGLLQPIVQRAKGFAGILGRKGEGESECTWVDY